MVLKLLFTVVLVFLAKLLYLECLCAIFSKTATLKNKNFIALFYGWGSTASELVLLRGGSLLVTTKFPDIPGTHFIDIRRLKG